MALSQSMYGPTVERVVGPTANDDSAAGYEVGTIWIDTVADEVFVAADVAVGAAVWVGPLTSTAHVPVTLGGGSDPALSLAGQALTLANVLTPAEHTAIGDAAPHHIRYADAEAIAAVEGEATLALTGAVTNAGSFAVPVGAAPVVNADGEIALDTTVAGWSHGIFRAYGGEELFLVAMPVAELGPADGFVIAYNAATDELEFVAVGGAGHTIRDDGADQPARTGLNFIGPIITVTDDVPGDEQEIAVDETQVDHDNLANFVANEHIDHTAVTLTAGIALSGGGDISVNRTFDHAQVAVGDLHQDYLLADGTRNLTGTMLVTAANALNFRDAQLRVFSAVDGQLNIDADGEVEITTPQVHLSGILGVGVAPASNRAINVDRTWDDAGASHTGYGIYFLATASGTGVTRNITGISGIAWDVLENKPDLVAGFDFESKLDTAVGVTLLLGGRVRFDFTSGAGSIDDAIGYEVAVEGTSTHTLDRFTGFHCPDFSAWATGAASNIFGFRADAFDASAVPNRYPFFYGDVGSALWYVDAAGRLYFTETTAPGIPPANALALYAKDKAGVSELYYKNDNGDERDLSFVSSITRQQTHALHV